VIRAVTRFPLYNSASAPEAKQCVDVCCFVVAADEVHAARVLNLERQQQAHRLQAMAAPASTSKQRRPTQHQRDAQHVHWPAKHAQSSNHSLLSTTCAWQKVDATSRAASLASTMHNKQKVALWFVQLLLPVVPVNVVA
jgi:hypothetical protein